MSSREYLVKMYLNYLNYSEIDLKSSKDEASPTHPKTVCMIFLLKALHLKKAVHRAIMSAKLSQFFNEDFLMFTIFFNKVIKCFWKL